MQNLLITLLIGVFSGYILFKLKIPGGMIIGAIIGVSIFNISTNMAYFPKEGKVAAQIIAGAFIGSGLEKGDFIRLKNIFKPTITILVALLILNITMGFIIYFISPMDLITSLMSAVPGSLSDIPIISEEMGADSSKVAVLHFVRMIFGIGVFPSMIYKFSKLKYFKDEEIIKEVYKRVTIKSVNSQNFALTVLISTISGIIGKMLGIPAGTLVFSMISIIIFKLLTGRAYLPRWVRRFAQILTGTYIGSGILLSDIIEIKYLLGPAIVIVLGYTITCILVGSFIHKKFNLPIRDAMLACTPAGASEMALIAADMGVESADVVVMQVIRLVVVISIFPQIISFIISILS